MELLLFTFYQKTTTFKYLKRVYILTYVTYTLHNAFVKKSEQILRVG